MRGVQVLRSGMPVRREVLHARMEGLLHGREEASSAFAEHSKKKWLEESDKGVVSKCDFCEERVEQGKKPACVNACPCEARTFGDLDDPESEVSQLIKKRRGMQLHPEYGTEACVYYLPAR